jgi:hypothetical protein
MGSNLPTIFSLETRHSNIGCFFVISAGTSNVDDAVDKRKSIYSLDKDGFIGFNPIVKRTCAAVTAKETQRPDLFPSPSHPAYT